METNKNLKRAKVHRLPTEDEMSYNIIKYLSGKLEYLLPGEIGYIKEKVSNQHLYFTTDEEIKEGDWFFANQLPHLCTEVREGDRYPYGSINSITNEKGYHSKFWNKIISSTDPKLINVRQLKDGSGRIKSDVAQPSQATIKAYCEQGGFNEVDVEYETRTYDEWLGGDMIPETYKKLKVDPIHNTITTHRIVEKMYSRDDMKKMWVHLGEQGWGDSSGEGFDKWIKENL